MTNTDIGRHSLFAKAALRYINDGRTTSLLLPAKMRSDSFVIPPPAPRDGSSYPHDRWV